MCLSAQLLSLWVKEGDRRFVTADGSGRGGTALDKEGNRKEGQSQGIGGRVAGGPKTQLCLVLNPMPGSE